MPDDPGPPAPPPIGRIGDRPEGAIWEDCPVTPLGVNGGTSYYLDVHGQLRSITKHDAQAVMPLFGHRMPALCWNFAQWSKDPDTGDMRRKPNAWNKELAAQAMIMASSEKGLFDPEGAVRGVGAWRDDDGRLIYHTGDGLFLGGERIKSTSHQGKIYPAYPPIPHPAVSDRRPDPVPDILATLETWQWSRPDLDPVIALGMICAQMLGGALDWRPVFWITGGAASGKSAFQKLVQLLHGDKGLIQSSDATKSGITSRLGQSSLPVMIDELEPGDDGSTKERDIIVLARVAASGGQWFRGSADQKGAGGNVYSTFMFSSILIPGALKPQDLSRLIIMTLRAFPKGVPPLTLRHETWRGRGAALKRILIDRWPLFTGRLDLWRELLESQGIGGRNADNWATVMTLADLVLHGEVQDDATYQSWAIKLARATAQDMAEMPTDADQMLLRLLTQPIDVYRRGEKHTVAQWLMAAAKLPAARQDLLSEAVSGDEYARAVNAKLATAGLRVSGSGAEAKLFIANAKIQGLLDLFKGSDWADGVWQQSAARVPGAETVPQPLTLSGIRTRGYLIPFTAIPGLAYLPMDRAAEGSSVAPTYTVEDFA